MDKNIEDIYPLSPMQQGILFHTLLAPKSGVYVPQFCCILDGSLNVSAFKQAWQQVVARHQVLRTSFHWERRDQPFQVVYRHVNLPWKEQDWRGVSSDEQQELLKNFLQKARQQGFDLNQPPLMRITLIQLTEDKYQLIWSQHHLILDGWSAGLVLKEVFETYNALHQCQNLPMPRSRPYGDYIAWLQKQDLSVAKEFWQEKLQGFTTPIRLRVDRNFGSTPSQEENQDEQQILLPVATTAALQSLAERHQLTLNTLVQGAFALLLSRYSDEEDVVFGATCSGRSVALAGVESMVGLFINTLPVRIHVARQEFVIPWLKNLQNQQAEALQYEYSPLLEIQEWSDVTRGMPLFENILVFENYPVNPSLLKQGKNLGIRDVRAVEWTSFPITVLVAAASELSIKIKYSCNRFDAVTITRMLGYFRTLLEGMVANPFQRLGELPPLTNTEQQQLLVWNNTQTDYPKDICIHQLFEAQVERSPDAIAVVFDLQQLSYRELNARANRIAHHLQILGVGPEVLVGIYMERSLEMLVGILAILKAGGSYIPIDPAYPQERLAFMLSDAQVQVLLTQAQLIETLPPHQAKVISLDTDAPANTQQSQENLISEVTTNSSAYVIYTSGSTGQPKGAINTHLGLCNRLLWMQNTYQLTAADRVLQKTPFSFDVSVWEFFWPLIVGARLVVVQPGGHQDSTYLVDLITSQQITTLHFVPSMLQVFLEEPGLEACKCLKHVICSGEVLPFELQKCFFASLDAELHNLYGPTEATIDVTSWACQSQSDLTIVPIGRPVNNTQIYLLDSQEQPVPLGVPGELHIGGDQLARGYLNRPELTAEKFIPNPYSDKPGARLYKTGDLARYLSDGNIEFLGRRDHQVKIRGFRIELGEIEVVLAKHPNVLASVVIAREDHPGDKRIVAYVRTQEQDVTATELRHFLKQSLPDYMIPADFVILETFPLLPNGKVNQRALPAPDTFRSGVKIEFVPPRHPVEEVIAAIWTDILKLEQIGIHDNFFELGGNSLLATRVNSRLRQAFGVDLPLRSLFEKPTVASLAERIETMRLTMQQLSRPPIAIAMGRKEIEI